MIEVELPDGSIAEFPDGTPPETIKGVLRKKFAPQQAAPAVQAAPEKPKLEPWFPSLTAATEGSFAGVMGGYDDEIGAAMLSPIEAGIDWAKGDGFDMGRAYTRKQQELDARKAARRQDHPIASIGGELAGGLALGGGASKAGLTVAGKSLPVIGKTGAAMLEGGAYGGLYGAGEAKPGERLQGAGTGAAIGAATGGALELAGRGVSRALAGKQAAIPARSSGDLAQEANALYAQSKAAGVTVKAPAFDRLANNVQVAAGRLNKDLRPNTAGIVDDVMALKGKNISLEELDELRQVVGQSMKNAQPQDVRTLTRIKDIIDSFSDNIKPGDITGDMRGFDYIKQGREIWARKAKTEVLEEIVEKAKNQATGFENGLVINMRALANNKAKMKAFTPQERQMINGVVRRGSAHGVLRALGMLSPNSTFGGLMTGGVGVGAGILPGAALAGTGMAARAGAGALTRGKVDRLIGAVSTGQAPQLTQLPNYLRPMIPGVTGASMGTGQSLATRR
jgi:hypothetical protein